MSTLSSSDPAIVIDGYGTAMPRLYLAATTLTSSAVADTGRWVGYGALGNTRNATQVGLRLGDVLLHVSSSGAGAPGRVSLHAVLSATSNAIGSTLLSSNYGTGYDVTVSLST